MEESGKRSNAYRFDVTVITVSVVLNRPHCGTTRNLLMKLETMTQLYLCEEPYWSKYDHSDLYDHPLEINVISDGKDYYFVEEAQTEVLFR